MIVPRGTLPLPLIFAAPNAHGCDACHCRSTRPSSEHQRHLTRCFGGSEHLPHRHQSPGLNNMAATTLFRLGGIANVTPFDCNNAGGTVCGAVVLPYWMSGHALRAPSGHHCRLLVCLWTLPPLPALGISKILSVARSLRRAIMYRTNVCPFVRIFHC